MATIRKTLFVSDLHLAEANSQSATQFLCFLEKLPNTIDAIYILGDLFDAWIGDDHETPFHQKIIAGLSKVTRKGIPIYYLHGNRDFFIGKRFLHATGLKVLPEEARINLYKTPILLMHGDTLCTQDVTYLRARKIAHTWVFKRLFLSLPLQLRKKIAEKTRNKSNMHKKSITLETMDVTPEAVIQKLEKHKVNYLIHGHTHRPAIHHSHLHTRIVLGAWDHHGSALVWDEKGNHTLLDITEIS